MAEQRGLQGRVGYGREKRLRGRRLELDLPGAWVAVFWNCQLLKLLDSRLHLDYRWVYPWLVAGDRLTDFLEKRSRTEASELALDPLGLQRSFISSSSLTCNFIIDERIKATGSEVESEGWILTSLEPNLLYMRFCCNFDYALLCVLCWVGRLGWLEGFWAIVELELL